LSIFSHLRLSYLCHLSKPAADRPIYRAIRRQRALKIVELGIGDGRRALRMIQVARLACPGQDILYVGIDPFEDRRGAGFVVPASAGCPTPSSMVREPAEAGTTNSPKLTLKAAHQLLRGAGVRVQLLPGNPPDTLARAANSLGKVDLLIVPAELDSPSLARVWFFVPRMLHQSSLVFVGRVLDDGQTAVRIKPREEIDALAAAGVSRRAA
jgi:hypothetical protein